MGWDSEYLHYTNADNPYGDNNLLETFVWKEKLLKEGIADLSKEEIEKRNRAKMEENRRELEKVKKRRLERELERAEREALVELEQRQREAAQFSQFSRQEDNFQLEQARIRSQIRVEDGRAKPIDLLAQYISSECELTSTGVLHVHEPYTHLTGLTLNDLEDLMEDIKVYQQLDRESKNQWYWSDLTIIVMDEIRRLKMRDAAGDTAATSASQRHGIHSAVAGEVTTMFRNKTVAELNKLQASIEAKLSGDTAGVDVGYWESLLSQLKAFQARARLRERHRDSLKHKLELLKAEQGVQPSENSSIGDSLPGPSTMGQLGEESVVTTSSEGSVCDTDEEVARYALRDGECDELVASALAAYSHGRFSPKLIKADNLEVGTDILEEEEDDQRLEWQRTTVLKEVREGQCNKQREELTQEERRLQKEAQKNMTADEVQFSVETKLDPQQYLWSDKYRPRKPRYFNRVHTGFEWNKYNQTHYDMDNPPPKIVQGYKFNIFYPDLIEKDNTPQYELVPIKDNTDFAMLKFTAGPPYEDIAFKIVNREWEYSYKRGFRCQFHNNIFQLWFHFKRYRYRR
ncbi:Cactin central domain [Trinorchestia longiramus]|nr:Cactin central domain [Trinorchestia longiramus]